jgi:hypothetical protein
MNPEIKKKWVKALRSGKYEQGRGNLKNSDGQFCCLGVLCDLYQQEHKDVEWKDKWGRITMLDHWSNLPWPVMVWSDMLTLPLFGKDQVSGFNKDRVSLIDLNDGRGGSPHSFKEIADVIERHLAEST